ncbi:MAG: NADH-quinone oxidoreductase subunit J, partial [Chloroflexi bacterium]|nr:NADH-quinone oxidoreductase subunit J [Chloroflexota bacterium]
IFYLIAALAVGGALGVVLARNAVYAALFLILALLAVAGVYILLGSEFLALVQVLIYAGAITVLLLFALMLTRTTDVAESMTGAQWPLAVVVSMVLGGLLIVTVTTSDWPGDADGTITRVLFEDLGEALFTQWAVPFEIASLVLFVALVGAIVIAREEEEEE